MKKLVILLGLLLVGSLSVMAEEIVQPEQDIEINLDKVFCGGTVISTKDGNPGQKVIVNKSHSFLYFTWVKKGSLIVPEEKK